MRSRTEWERTPTQYRQCLGLRSDRSRCAQASTTVERACAPRTTHGRVTVGYRELERTHADARNAHSRSRIRPNASRSRSYRRTAVEQPTTSARPAPRSREVRAKFGNVTKPRMAGTLGLLRLLKQETLSRLESTRSGGRTL